MLNLSVLSKIKFGNEVQAFINVSLIGL